MLGLKWIEGNVTCQERVPTVNCSQPVFTAAADEIGMCTPNRRSILGRAAAVSTIVGTTQLISFLREVFSKTSFRLQLEQVEELPAQHSSFYKATFLCSVVG
jgi:hypothetical protein